MNEKSPLYFVMPGFMPGIHDGYFGGHTSTLLLRLVFLGRPASIAPGGKAAGDMRDRL
jgi:hypothetical protein